MTNLCLYTFITLWLITVLKETLFWLYLWQIKNYHLPRFLAHFETYKGKRLLFNKTLLFELIISLIFIFGVLYNNGKIILTGISFEILLYLAESLKFVLDIYKKRLKKPIWTSKSVTLFTTLFLVSISYLIFLLSSMSLIRTYSSQVFFYFFLMFLLIFSILVPITVSIIVFAFQPVTIYIRKRTIKKAETKRKNMKNLLVIGITGSYGKTSTKEFLSTILSSKYNVLKTRKNQNSEFGIARTILKRLKPEHEIFIAEMGAYCRGGIKFLADIAQPNIGIIAGINQQHLSTFGSQENIIKTKYELIQSLPRNGLAIFNGDNNYCLDLYKKTKINKKIISSEKKGITDLWAENIQVGQQSTSFDVVSKNGERSRFQISVLGKQNIPNILLATACAGELGMSLEEISKACLNIEVSQGAISSYKGINDVRIIESSYSSNPAGVTADLDYLNIFPEKKIVIMPCLIELNGASAQIHYQIGEKIGKICNLAIITTRDMIKKIREGARKSGMKEGNIIFSEKPSVILKKIKPLLNSSTTILIEGRVPQKLIEILKTNPKS